MLVAAILITAWGYFLTEYVLQKTRLGIWKRKKFTGLLAHAFLWTAFMCPGLGLLGIFAPWKVCFLFLTHTIIDYLKMKLKRGRIKAAHPVNIFDQLLHLLTLIIVYTK